MGTFVGHATPGIMFILYAIWYAVKQAHNRVKLAKDLTRYPYPKPYSNGNHNRYGEFQPPITPMRDVPLFPYDKIVEGAFFLACSCGGALGIVAYGGFKLVNSNGNFTSNLNNWQHGTMFAFFGMHFVITILGQTKHRLQPEMEKLFQALPFFVEAFLFYFHLHGRTDLDVHLHHLLILAILGSAVCLLAEAWKPGDPLLENMWVVSCLLHGMWFLMVGFILYNPIDEETAWGDKEQVLGSWGHDEHKSMMMVTAMYTWQFLLAIVINTVIRWIVVFCVTRNNGNDFSSGVEEKVDAQFRLEETAEMTNLLDSTDEGL